MRIKQRGQQAYAWVTSKVTSFRSHYHHHPASIAQKLELPSEFLQLYYKIAYRYVWRVLPMPILMMTYMPNLSIVSYYKMMTKRGYLNFVKSNRVITFPSSTTEPDGVIFCRPPNETGEPGKMALVLPVIAYVEQK